MKKKKTQKFSIEELFKIDDNMKKHLQSYHDTLTPSEIDSYLNYAREISLYVINYKFGRKELHLASEEIADETVKTLRNLIEKDGGDLILRGFKPVGHTYLLTRNECMSYLFDKKLLNNKNKNSSQNP
jgi:hypothetical protein